MKKYFYFLLIVFSGNIIIAQDIIIKTNREEIKAKIIEITDDAIKYKEFNFQDGPTRNIKISEVFMILYENGKREKFTKKFTNLEHQASNEISPNVVVPNKTAQIEEPKQQSIKKKQKESYFSVGAGWGNSFGGVGLKLQFVINGKIGLHAGGGYFNDEILYSGGVQFYFWNRMYFDAQYGAFGTQEIWEFSNYNSYYESKLLIGPSLLFGYDWYFTKHFGVNGAIGASYDLAEETDFWPAFDAGFIFKF